MQEEYQGEGRMKPITDFMDKVICGDCLTVMKEIPDNSVDLILTDPPYGITSCDWDYMPNLQTMMGIFKRIIKPNGAIVITSSQPFTSKLILSNLGMFKYEFIWEKTKASGFQNAKRIPMKRHESIIVFYDNQPTFNQLNLTKLDNPIKSGRERNHNPHNLGVAGKPEHYTEYTGWQDSIIKIANPSGKGHLHPTQKPVRLFEYLIRIYSNKGQLVLDPFLGSGTTAVACKQLNRHFIGIEINPEYCEIARKRIQAVPKRLDKFIVKTIKEKV